MSGERQLNGCIGAMYPKGFCLYSFAWAQYSNSNGSNSLVLVCNEDVLDEPL